ncbi:hypothetical protein SDC9_206805 [bioreactor metagenome]|uniref:Uncharacterized protein n=1 Tax=bioreactor metagenome TaxID=1076179 RepID=A0A645J6R7_9ZZZZ
MGQGGKDHVDPLLDMFLIRQDHIADSGVGGVHLSDILARKADRTDFFDLGFGMSGKQTVQFGTGIAGCPNHGRFNHFHPPFQSFLSMRRSDGLSKRQRDLPPLCVH